MRLLAMPDPRNRRRHGEALASLMGGVPSLTIGGLAIVLLASYMLHTPVGPPDFYRVEWFRASRPSAPGGTWPVPSVSIVLPSATMFGMFCAAMGVATRFCRQSPTLGNPMGGRLSSNKRRRRSPRRKLRCPKASH